MEKNNRQIKKIYICIFVAGILLFTFLVGGFLLNTKKDNYKNNDVKEIVLDYEAVDDGLICNLEEPEEGNFQYTIGGLSEGYYYITAFVSYEGGSTFCYLTGEGIDKMGNSLLEEQKKAMTSVPYKSIKDLITIRGIYANEDGCIKFSGCIPDKNESKLVLHSFRVHREEKQDEKYHLLMGGALSRINYVESAGAKFYDFEGKERDPIEIMKENGINFCRLELYNNPGKGRGDGRYYCPDGFQDRDDILNIAKRAFANDMEIELSFMFSDFWTYGIPSDFMKDIGESANEEKIVNILENDLYIYVKETMELMKNQGTVPKYVSLGNEMNGGFFLPYGDSTNNMENLARFINAGYKAVKEVSEESQVVLHISCNADDMKWEGNGTGSWFFGLCEEYNVNYDIIGTSFYPFWAETLKCSDFTKWCNLMIKKFDKDILLMETGFNYRKDTETGSRGQLYNMGAYEGFYDYSEEGQRDYMIELINAIKCVDGGRCIGFLYWDPIMVAGDGIGWSMKEYDDKADKNVISNTTWFDFDHKALKVFDTFRYN